MFASTQWIRCEASASRLKFFPGDVSIYHGHPTKTPLQEELILQASALEKTTKQRTNLWTRLTSYIIGEGVFHIPRDLVDLETTAAGFHQELKSLGVPKPQSGPAFNQQIQKITSQQLIQIRTLLEKTPVMHTMNPF